MENSRKAATCWKCLADGVLNRRITAKRSSDIQVLEERVKELKTKSEILATQLRDSQTLLKLQMRSDDVKYGLLNALHEHYRRMVGQALAINRLTSQLIAEEGTCPNVRQEIHKVSQESNAVLRLIIKDFPMKADEKPVDVLQSVQEVKEIFLPMLTQCNINITMQGKLESQPSLDNTILMVILYNIFYIITKRLRNKGSMTIELKDEECVQIVFYDNGYDLEGNYPNFLDSRDILFWGAQKLKEFVTYLGWEIHFQYPKEGLNIITLMILPKCSQRNLPKNVVKLFNYNLQIPL